MAEPVVLRVFCEDHRHESFARALIARIARELGVQVDVRTVSARGGLPKARTELKAFLRQLRRGQLGQRTDLVVALIDANCSGHTVKAKEIRAVVGESEVAVDCIIACPDPHIERWLMADRAAFKEAVEIEAPADPGKCERDLYKKLLHSAIREAGHPLPGQQDFSSEIIERMDLYAAGKRQPSLGQLCDDLRAALQRLRPS